eukprot:scaffold123236_cov42-Phaeocystis_antarctica.AAC.1
MVVDATTSVGGSVWFCLDLAGTALTGLARTARGKAAAAGGATGALLRRLPPPPPAAASASTAASAAAAVALAPGAA